jgi:protein TonB
METTTISLARLLELDVPRSWQEVVAVTMGAGDAMQRVVTALTAELCVISTNGELAYTGKGSHPGGAVGALRALLAALLENQGAPAELRALAAPGGSSDAAAFEALMTSLAYYERPSRQADVAALAVRALDLDAQRRGDEELERLRSAPRATSAVAAIGSGLPRLLRVAAATAVAGGVVVTAAAWYLGRPQALSAPQAPVASGSWSTPAPSEPSAVGSLVSKASDAAAGVAAAGLRAIGIVPADPNSADPAPAPTATPPAAPRPKRPRVEPAAAGDPNAAITPGDPIAAVVPTLPAVELPVVAADPEESASTPLPSEAFTVGDADVEPPVLVYPQLPTEPGASPPGSDEPHFELLVNERGEVEQARLRATEVRLQDRMMVSAVKAWRFKPAIKDGRPVRYRVRIPISK